MASRSKTRCRSKSRSSSRSRLVALLLLVAPASLAFASAAQAQHHRGGRQARAQQRDTGGSSTPQQDATGRPSTPQQGTTGRPSTAQPDATGPQTTVQQMMAVGADAHLDAQARARFGVGLSLYEEGRFAESAREFEGAYALSHRPELLFNVYVANRDDNDLERAVPALRDYLAAMTANLPNRINLEARLQAMEATLAERAAAAQVSAQQAAEVAAARQRAAEAEAARREAEHLATSPSGAGSRLSIPGLVIGGVGVASVVVGLVVGALALGKVSKLEATCPANLCPASARGTYDSAQTFVTAADILIIAGAVLAVGGFAMLWLGVGASSDDQAGARALASCGPTGCLVGVLWRF